MALPWVAQIVLAIFSDNISCCGSRRKSYLIINSIINFISIILLILFGIQCGKWFIIGCIVVSQICMTWSDAISNALIAQASRFDLKKGSANLNSITIIAYGLGGLIACVSAGLIELDDGHEVDPNMYFGTYAGLIFILFIASCFLNKRLEPERILQHRIREKYKKRLAKERERQIMLGVLDDGIALNISESSKESLNRISMCDECNKNFKAVGHVLSFPEFYLSLTFFIIQGILIPNFDDLHYIFLIEVVNMPKYEYDFLNTITYATIIVFAVIYNLCLTRV